MDLDDIERAKLALQSIFALSAAGKLIRDYLKKGEPVPPDELEETLKGREISASAAKHFSNIIDETLLEHLSTRIGKELERLRDSFHPNSGVSSPERQRIADEVDRTICRELSFIKKFNNKTLPHHEDYDFYELAERHNCQSVL